MITSHQKKAQQIVEFLLIAPFVIAFLALFTEYGYALNINLTLTKALKASTSRVYQYSRPNMTEEDLINFVKNNLVEELKSNYIPIQDENKINVSLIEKDKIGIFMARYTYIPAFSLPAIFFKIMPNKFDFMTTSAVPIALLKQNNFSGAKTSLELDEIWSASNFSDLNSFNGKKFGILKFDTNEKRSKILFLLPCSFLNSIIPNSYLLINWNGDCLKTDNNKYLVYTKNNSKLQLCKQSGENTSCESSSLSAFEYLVENDIYYVYVVYDNMATTATDSWESLNDLKNSYWNKTNSADLSDSSISLSNSGILKRIVSLNNMDAKAIGNYDNIKVNDNNIIYIYPFGSMIFIDKTSEIRDKITNGMSRPSFNDFAG